MGKHILVVDDDINTREAIRRNLRKISSNISSASSGVEALNFLKQEQVDIIISDFHMPVLNGREFLKIVNNIYPNIKTIILTGKADYKESLNIINELNLNKFLTKPYSKADLFKTILELIEN